LVNKYHFKDYKKEKSGREKKIGAHLGEKGGLDKNTTVLTARKSKEKVDKKTQRGQAIPGTISSAIETSNRRWLNE